MCIFTLYTRWRNRVIIITLVPECIYFYFVWRLPNMYIAITRCIVIRISILSSTTCMRIVIEVWKKYVYKFSTDGNAVIHYTTSSTIKWQNKNRRLVQIQKIIPVSLVYCLSLEVSKKIFLLYYLSYRIFIKVRNNYVTTDHARTDIICTIRLS